jgi:glycyl-tRNA synthetase
MRSIKKLSDFCKKRGFIFQSSEPYGGIKGLFDYGPLGVELKNNIKDFWWIEMVKKKSNIFGLESSILSKSNIWKSSGHLKNFVDLMSDCKISKNRFRTDQLLYGLVKVLEKPIGYISIFLNSNEKKMKNEIEKKIFKIKKNKNVLNKPHSISLKKFTFVKKKELPYIPSPYINKIGSLTLPRNFNLMFKTKIGAIENSNNKDINKNDAYLRPETTQGSIMNFNNIINSNRIRIPFGIAQIGKVFRNEITPRNFLFRMREFEQMEIQYFIYPHKKKWKSYYREWIQKRFYWISKIVPKKFLEINIQDKKDLAYYAKSCTDINFKFPFGKFEIEGISVRTEKEFKNHKKFTKKIFKYFDHHKSKKYFPYIIEPSIGVDRIFLAVLLSSYKEEIIKNNDGDYRKRVFLKINPILAPIKLSILPIVKNNKSIVLKSKNLFEEFLKKRGRWNIFYDEKGTIGKRYRRMDEIGTPYCITIDFQTIKDNTVTIRERDSMKQNRISINKIINFFDKLYYI